MSISAQHHEKIIYITAKSAGFLKDSYKFSAFCLLSLAYPFLPFRLFYTVQSYELQMLEVFTHSFSKAERFALNMEDLWGPRADQPWGISKREEILVSEITNQSQTGQGGERAQWKEMLCLLPAALPSAAEGGGCVSVCSRPLTTKDLFKMHARRRIRAGPSLLSFVQEEEGSIALGYWSLGSPTTHSLLPSAFPLYFAITFEKDCLIFQEWHCALQEYQSPACSINCALLM